MARDDEKETMDRLALEYVVLRTYNLVLSLTELSEETISEAESRNVERLSLSPIEGLDPASSDHYADSIAAAIGRLHASAREMREAVRKQL